MFGYDNDYANHHFNGIYGRCPNHDNMAYFSVENYRIIAKCQNWDKSAEAMCDAILENKPDESNDMLIRLIDEGFISLKDDKLSATFPVFSQDCIDNEVWEILKPIAEDVCNCMIQICNTAINTLKNHVPKALKDKCDQLGFIHHQMDVCIYGFAFAKYLFLFYCNTSKLLLQYIQKRGAITLKISYKPLVSCWNGIWGKWHNPIMSKSTLLTSGNQNATALMQTAKELFASI